MSRLFDPEFHADRPVDLLHDVGDVLTALDLAVSADHNLMTPRASNGLGLLLRATVKAVDDARDMVEWMVSDPFSAGYRKGVDLANAEYHRGFKEGRAAVSRADEVAA